MRNVPLFNQEPHSRTVFLESHGLTFVQAQFEAGALKDLTAIGMGARHVTDKHRLVIQVQRNRNRKRQRRQFTGYGIPRASLDLPAVFEQALADVVVCQHPGTALMQRQVAANVVAVVVGEHDVADHGGRHRQCAEPRQDRVAVLPKPVGVGDLEGRGLRRAAGAGQDHDTDIIARSDFPKQPRHWTDGPSISQGQDQMGVGGKPTKTVE